RAVACAAARLRRVVRVGGARDPAGAGRAAADARAHGGRARPCRRRGRGDRAREHVPARGLAAPRARVAPAAGRRAAAVLARPAPAAVVLVPAPGVPGDRRRGGDQPRAARRDARRPGERVVRAGARPEPARRARRALRRDGARQGGEPRARAPRARAAQRRDPGAHGARRAGRRPARRHGRHRDGVLPRGARSAHRHCRRRTGHPRGPGGRRAVGARVRRRHARRRPALPPARPPAPRTTAGGGRMTTRPGVRVVLRDDVTDRAAAVADAAATAPPSDPPRLDVPPEPRTPAEVEVEDRETARAIVRHGRVRARRSARRWGRGVRYAVRRPGLVVAVLVVLLVAAWAVVPQLFTAYDPLTGVPADRLLPPSADHPFGTDHLGRDVYARVVHGASASLSATALAVAVGLVAGSLLGLLAGFLRGWVDDVVGRFVDVLLAIPSILLSLAIITALGF